MKVRGEPVEETKLDKVDGRVISSIWGNRFAGWEVLDAVHTAGGVLLLWDKRVVERVDSKVRVCMARIGMTPDLSFGLSWRKFGISGLSRGVFLVISMWLGSLANGGVVLELLLLWRNSRILLKGST
uniref:Uncharacterized protein n=1 Tax=Fagus sylvatica TaxID=28930 RepID=A0A2N9IWJ9_FAGSY